MTPSLVHGSTSAAGPSCSTSTPLRLPQSLGDAAQLRALFDGWALTYAQEHESWGCVAPQRMAAMLKAAGFHAGSRVLDIGCGVGLSGAAMRAAGIGTTGGIVGVDLSDESLDEAFACKAYQDTRLHNLEEPWPFADASFDAVVAVGVTPYISDFSHLYSEMCRVARQGALISWTSLEHSWADDERKCASTAEEFAGLFRWKQVRIDPPERWAPHAPDEANGGGGGSHQIRYHLIAYRRLRKSLEAEELQRREEEAKQKRREESVASIETVRGGKEEARQKAERQKQWEMEVESFQSRKRPEDRVDQSGGELQDQEEDHEPQDTSESGDSVG